MICLQSQACIVEQFKSYSTSDLSLSETASVKSSPSRHIKKELDDDELDNRLIEERYNREIAEMAEKERSAVVKRSASTRVRKSREAGRCTM